MKTTFISVIVLIAFLTGCQKVNSAQGGMADKMNKGDQQIQMDKTFIIDQTGERWDISQAKSIGFKPKGFQYGIGRNAFTPLDDSYLTEDSFSVSGKLRVIGVTESSQAQAYSVSKLMHHEIANTRIGSKPIMVGY